jgi:hypothetical protein
MGLNISFWLSLVGNKRQYAALLVSDCYSDSEVCAQLTIELMVLRATKAAHGFPNQVEEMTRFMRMVRAGRAAKEKTPGSLNGA